MSGIFNMGLVYDICLINRNTMCSYVDDDYASDVDKRRLQSGYEFTILGNVVSWKPLCNIW